MEITQFNQAQIMVKCVLSKMKFNHDYLKYKPIFTPDEVKHLDNLNNQFTLKEFFNNPSIVNKYGFDFIFASAKIEGNTYTKEEALTLLTYGITAAGKQFYDAQMLINLKKAYDYITTEKNIQINKLTIRQIHTILAHGLLDNTQIGIARNQQILITGTDYTPLTDKNSLEAELDQILNTYNTIQNPYDKAIYIHNNLAYLQYFIDINKRTSRFIQNISLMNDNKLPLILREEYINNYIDGLISYYETGSYDKYKQFFIQNYTKIANLLNELKNS